jgi:hypothetical protein
MKTNAPNATGLLCINISHHDEADEKINFEFYLIGASEHAMPRHAQSLS